MALFADLKRCLGSLVLSVFCLFFSAAFSLHPQSLEVLMKTTLEALCGSRERHFRSHTLSHS